MIQQAPAAPVVRKKVFVKIGRPGECSSSEKIIHREEGWYTRCTV